MAKVNLLTIHYGENNGSVLQTYATVKLLEKYGHEVTIIDLWAPHFIFNWKNLDHWVYLLRRFNTDRLRKRLFPKLTTRMTMIQPSKIPAADYTIVGSDQVWNRDITKERALAYFLNFVPESSKRIALSSSFGKAIWDEDEDFTEKVKEELKKFSAISVREESGVNICKNTFGVDAICTIDPTLALHDFSDILPQKVSVKKEVGCFTFKPDGYSIRVAEEIAKREALAVRHVNFAGLRKRSKHLTGHYWKNSPDRWLKYIAQSSFFVTDSFHGVACCIILRKQFAAVCADQKKFERLKSLLQKLGLERQIVQSLDELNANYKEIMSPIDYDSVFPIIEKESLKIETFIKTNIC